MEFRNKAEHAVQSYDAGVVGLGAQGPGAMGCIYNMLSNPMIVKLPILE